MPDTTPGCVERTWRTEAPRMPRMKTTASGMKRAALPSLLALLLAAAAVPASPAGEVTAVKAGLLIDGTGGEPVRGAVVLVEDGHITAAGAGVQVPEGARVIDLSDRVLLPGFIDAHVHLAGRYVGEGLY